MKKLCLFLSALVFLAACESEQSGGDNNQSPMPDDYRGEGAMCGGIAGFQCSNSEHYCAMSIEQANTADGAGVCTVKPQICTREYRPVCGTDGVTYSNACMAATVGVNVTKESAC